MKNMTVLMILTVSFAQNLIITGAYDGPLSGGTPKGVELYVISNISDLSVYGLGSANNGGGSDEQEFTFPSVAATAGDFLYIASSSANFNNWFGFDADYTTGAMAINGDDAIELYHNNSSVDVFGDINTDGNGESWEYMDGWAYSKSNRGTSTIFNDAHWTYSGPNALDGETSNSGASTPFPSGTFTYTDGSLPVELTLFIAVPQKGSVKLSWATESEIDNLGFLIDRSLEPSSGFTTIADYRFVPELQGQGSVTYRTDYYYTDREVVPGTKYYYVLSDVTGNPEHGEPVTRHTDKMVSATPKWQDISSALINGFKTFKAYPNPFNPKTVIAYELEDVRELSVSIVDVHGRQVTELYSGLQAPGFHKFTWQPKDISAGIYFCHLTSGGNTITRKLVLLK